MNDEFKYKIYLPSKSRYYYFTQLNNQTYTTLAKIIANDDSEQLNKLFCKMVYTMSSRRVDPRKITRVDMFCILLNIYIICVSNSIEMKGEVKDGVPQAFNLDLYSVLDKVTNFKFDYTQDVQVNQDVSMTLKCPSVMYVSETDDLIADCVESLTIYGNKHNLIDLTLQQKRNVLDNVPADVITSMITKMTEINDEYQLTVIDNPEQEQKIVISLYNNSMFEILKLIYRQSLEAQYFYKYFLSKHLNIPDIDAHTPAEIQTYMRFFKQEQEEIEKQRKAQEKGSTGGTHLGGPIPGVE